MNKDNYLVGLDLGSISVNAIVIDREGKILYEEDYRRHNGQPLTIAKEITMFSPLRLADVFKTSKYTLFVRSI